MKYLLAMLLVLTVNANAFAGIGLCMMEHSKMSDSAVSMPCHEQAQVEEHNIEPHLCDCEMCPQCIQPLASHTFFEPSIEASYFHDTRQPSIVVAAKYRPPIN